MTTFAFQRRTAKFYRNIHIDKMLKSFPIESGIEGEIQKHSASSECWKTLFQCEIDGNFMIKGLHSQQG